MVDGLLFFKDSINIKITEPFRLTAAFNAVRIGNPFSKHLIAPADADNPAPLFNMPLYLFIVSTLPEVIQVCQRVFCPGDYDDICLPYLLAVCHIPQAGILFCHEWIKVRKVGYMRELYDGNPQRTITSGLLFIVALKIDPILFLYIDILHVWDDTKHRETCLSFKKLNARP